jgi:hypothetical protein
MRCLAAFMVFTLTISAFGQSCERTVPVSLAFPGYSIQGLALTDFQATLNDQNINVVKAEPLRQSRLLILLLADYTSRITHKKDFERAVAGLSAIQAIPKNVSIAYGVYAKKIVFSDRFTSDPQELRQSLAALVSQAESDDLGREVPDHDCLLNPVLDFLGTPQPGDALVRIVGNGSLLRYGPVDFDIRSSLAENGLGGLTYCVAGHKKDDDFNLQFVRKYFAENALREFQLHFYEKEATYRSSFTPALSMKWEKVESILLNDLVDGYLVTVAVPDITLDKNARWHLGRKNEVKRRPGQPVTTGIFAYPDLLLCNPAKDGSLRYASTGRLPFVGMEVK